MFLRRSETCESFLYLLSPIINKFPTKENYTKILKILSTGTDFGRTGSVTIGGATCPLVGSGYDQDYVECTAPAGLGRCTYKAIFIVCD